MSLFTQHIIDENGLVRPKKIADELHTTIREISTMSGLSLDAVSKSSRVGSKNSQKRLRDMTSVLNRALPWCGSIMQAYAWYRSEPLPSFGDLTAEELVKRDMADAVLNYFNRISEGGFA
ncbi:MAG: XRE family transcriptional regulator [Gammaproteobacteria bacterium]|nr:XRE family transcriptional regulator [Gammaproteobacteria bacterium]